MAAILALGKTLGDNAVSVIFEFLEESSIAATRGMDTCDIANLGEIDEYYIVAPFTSLYLDSHCPNKFGLE